jgi:hypothetical protein
MLEIASLFRTYYHFRTYTSQSGLPHLYKSVLALLYRTFYLVTPLISSTFPSFSSSEFSLSLLLTLNRSLYTMHLIGLFALHPRLVGMTKVWRKCSNRTLGFGSHPFVCKEVPEGCHVDAHKSE